MVFYDNPEVEVPRLPIEKGRPPRKSFTTLGETCKIIGHVIREFAYYFSNWWSIVGCRNDV